MKTTQAMKTAQLQLFDDLLDAHAQMLADEIAQLPEPERIAALNRVRQILHAISPFRHEPVDCVLWVPADQVEANDYNPNIVAPPEMKLLKRSIQQDGYTQPIVVWPDGSTQEPHYTVVDGFHRNRVGKEDGEIRTRLRGYLPVTAVRTDREGLDDRITATIRHNRARGKHQVMAMSEIVRDLAKRNHSDAWIARELGMDPDEVLRLKQISGLAELFADREFSEAWEVVSDAEPDSDH